MRIPSGVTDQYCYFVALNGGLRVTGLSSFTVYRSRNGGAAAAFTTPTINETDATNMPGVYELLLDEDMTIGSGNDTEAMVFHISATGMDDVTREIELYRPETTAGETLTVSSGVGTANATLIEGSDATDQINAACDTAISDFWTTPGTLVDLIWDEVLTGATHNVVNSAGRRLRTLQDFGVYEDASVWVDEDNGTSTGTTSFEDATVTNRSNDFDNAQTVAGNSDVNLTTITVTPGNSITLTATLSGFIVNNFKATIDGGGQDVSECEFNSGVITGDWNQTTGFPRFNGVRFFGPVTAVSLPQFVAFGSSIVGTLQLTEAANQSLIDCIAGGTAIIDCNSLGSGTIMNLVRCTGNFTFNNLASGAVLNINNVGGGDIVLNGADATVNIDGIVSTVTNNLTGSPTVTDNAVHLANINAEADTAISDAFNFGVTGKVDANITHVNEIEITGDGQSGTEFGPA